MNINLFFWQKSRIEGDNKPHIQGGVDIGTRRPFARK